MLSPKQNFLETLKRDGHPDRLVNQYEYGAFLRGDPINMAMHKPFYMGMDPQKDAFGTTFIWPDGYAASMPHVTDDNKVIPDITRWKEFLKLPQLAPIENDTARDVISSHTMHASRLSGSAGCCYPGSPSCGRTCCNDTTSWRLPPCLPYP